MRSHRARLPGNILASERSKEHSARLASAQVVMSSALRGFRECLAVHEKFGRHPTSAEPPTVGDNGKWDFEGYCRKISIYKRRSQGHFSPSTGRRRYFLASSPCA